MASTTESPAFDVYPFAVRAARRALAESRWSTAHAGVPAAAAGSFELHERVGRKVLHRLKGPDRYAELLPLRDIGNDIVERAAHDPHDVGCNHRQRERQNFRPAVGQDRRSEITDLHRGSRRVDGDQGPCEIEASEWGWRQCDRDKMPVVSGCVDYEPVRGTGGVERDQVVAELAEAGAVTAEHGCEPQLARDDTFQALGRASSGQQLWDDQGLSNNGRSRQRPAELFDHERSFEAACIDPRQLG